MAGKKIKSPGMSDAEKVEAYMSKLDHPMKAETEALRKIIKSANPNLSERIKWNAPSYYYNEDVVTFGPYRNGKVLLVFHHPAITSIKSEILEGDYPGRRLAWFDSMKTVKQNKKELQRIVNELINRIAKKRNSSK